LALDVAGDGLAPVIEKLVRARLLRALDREERRNSLLRQSAGAGLPAGRRAVQTA